MFLSYHPLTKNKKLPLHNIGFRHNQTYGILCYRNSLLKFIGN